MKHATSAAEPTTDSDSPIHAGTPNKGTTLSSQAQLTAEQETDFVKFKTLCTNHAHNLDDVEDEECRDGIDDDLTLLRFFKARKCNAEKAYEHFEAAHRARKVNRIGRLYKTIDTRHFDETATLYPKWTGRRDKRGLPVYYIFIPNVNPSSIAAHKNSSNSMAPVNEGERDPNEASMDIRRACAVLDHGTRFVFPLCSAATDRPQDEIPTSKQIIIADITGMSMSNIWHIRGYIQEFSKLLSVSYPEVLDCVLIIGAPYFIHTIWSWIKNWVDPVTFAKLKLIDSKEVLSTLSSYIDPENVPVKYGGKFEVAEESWPNLDETLRETLVWHTAEKSLPSGPIIWKHGQDGSKVAVAVGTADNNSRQSEIASLK